MSASGHCLVPVMTAPNEPPCLHLGCEVVDGRAVAPILLHGQLFWGRKQVLVTQAPPTNMASDAALAGDPRRETPLRTAEREDCPLLGDEMQILSHHKLPLCVRTRLDARGEFEFHGCFLWAFVSVPTNLDEITTASEFAPRCACVVPQRQMARLPRPASAMTIGIAVTERADVPNARPPLCNREIGEDGGAFLNGLAAW